MPPWGKTFRAQLGAVAVLGLIVRVWAVLAWSRLSEPVGDQKIYWHQAQDLASGYGFVYRNDFGERVATAIHPPLYSAYLALVGLFRFPADSHTPYRLASALLGTAAVVVIGLAARKVAGNRAGVIAAFLGAIYPNLWLNDAMLVSESMFALTMALVVLAAATFHGERGTRNAVVLGVTVALATLTRAEAQLLFPLLVVPLVLVARDETWRRRLASAGLAVGAGALVLLPWVGRNFLTFETHPLTVTTGSGFVIEIANCDQTYGLAAPTTSPDDPPDKYLGYWAVDCDRTLWPPGDETVVGAAKQQAGVDYVKSHQRQLPVVLAARVGRMWEVWRPGQSYDFNKFFERRGDATTKAAMAMYYPLALAALAGLGVLARRRTTIVPYLAIFATTTVAAAVSFGITRYRVGAEVALVVLAAVALDAALRAWRPAPNIAEPAGRGTDEHTTKDDALLVATTSGDPA